MKQNIKAAKSKLMGIVRRLPLGLNAFLCVVVGITAYRYLFDIGPVFEIILGNTFKTPFLLMHIATAATAIIVAPFQLFPSILRRWPRVHRYVGRVYGVACLLGAISGLPLALGSAAGPIATAGFGLLAIAWFFTTAQGWRTAMQGRFADHKEWMLRSFALTNAAVTLRIYLALLPVLGLPFLESYRAISWLCWVPNILAVELYLALKHGRSARSSGLARA